MTKDFKDTFIGKLTKPNGEIDFDTWEGLSYKTKKTALKELEEWFDKRGQSKRTFGDLTIRELWDICSQFAECKQCWLYTSNICFGQFGAFPEEDLNNELPDPPMGD